MTIPLLRVEGNRLFLGGVELRRQACAGMGCYEWQPAHDQHIQKVAMSPNRQKAATFAMDGNVQLWNLTSDDKVKGGYACYLREPEKVAAIAVSDAGNIATSTGNAVSIFGLPGEVRERPTDTVASLQWVGETLFVRDALGTEGVYVYNSRNRQWSYTAAPQTPAPAETSAAAPTA